MCVYNAHVLYIVYALPQHHCTGNPEVRHVVDSVVSEHLTTLFEWQPALFSALCSKALAAQAASVAAKAAREMVRKNLFMFLYGIFDYEVQENRMVKARYGYILCCFLCLLSHYNILQHYI